MTGQDHFDLSPGAVLLDLLANEVLEVVGQLGHEFGTRGDAVGVKHVLLWVDRPMTIHAFITTSKRIEHSLKSEEEEEKQHRAEMMMRLAFKGGAGTYLNLLARFPGLLEGFLGLLCRAQTSLSLLVHLGTRRNTCGAPQRYATYVATRPMSTP
jgi:hypothetical protein